MMLLTLHTLPRQTERSLSFDMLNTMHSLTTQNLTLTQAFNGTSGNHFLNNSKYSDGNYPRSWCHLVARRECFVRCLKLYLEAILNPTLCHMRVIVLSSPGISLSVEQWQKLKEIAPKIDKVLS